MGYSGHAIFLVSLTVALLAVAFPAPNALVGLDFIVHQNVVSYITFLKEDFPAVNVSADEHLPYSLGSLAEDLDTGVVVMLID